MTKETRKASRIAMAPPFTTKHCLQFFFWVALLLLAIFALGWLLFNAESHKSIRLGQSQMCACQSASPENRQC